MKVPINKKRRPARSRASRTSPLLPRGKKARQQLELLGSASVSMLTIVIVLMFAASSTPHYAMRNKEVAAVVSSVLVDLANGDRTANNLGILKIDPELVAAAQSKADDMAAKGYFAHVAPDGTDPWHWFDKAGYAYDYAGENLAIDFSDSADVEHAWMNSPTHRENILNGRFTEIGIATAQGMYEGRMTTFVVQEFGAPKGTYSTIAPAAVVPANPAQLAVATAHVSPIAKAKVASRPESTHVLGTSSAGDAGSVIAQNATYKAAEDAAPPVVRDSAVYTPEKPPLWAYMIGVPHATLRYMYYLLGLFVILMLVYTTRFELRKRHIRHAAGAGFLVGLMGVLLMVAQFTIFAEPVLAMTR